jgi:hypothetical protein
MYCTNCGMELRPVDRFCTNCGAQQPTGAPSPPPPVVQDHIPPPPLYPEPQVAVQPPQAPPVRQGRRRGCCSWGCIVIGGLLVILLVAVGLVIAMRSDVLARLGLRQSPAERLLSGEPDRQAAQLIMDELGESGVDTQGMSLYVLPIEGQSYSLAYAVLDASAGFRFDSTSGGDSVVALLERLATADATGAYAVGRVAIDYRGPEGNRVLTLTAPTQAIRDFAGGRITRDAFLQALEGDFDPQELYGELVQ